MAYVDANIFFLAAFDTSERGKKAVEILNRFESGAETGMTCSLAIDELMWAIIKQKRVHRLEETVRLIYQIPNLHVIATPSKAPLLALEFIREHEMRPRDAIHCAVMRENSLTTIYSDDSDFDRVKWIKRKF